MADADEQRQHLRPGPQDDADLLAACPSAGRLAPATSGGSSANVPMYRLLATPIGGEVERDAEVRGQPAPAGVGVPLAVEADDAVRVRQLRQCSGDGRALAEAEEPRHVRHVARLRGSSRPRRSAARRGRRRRRRRRPSASRPRTPRPPRRRTAAAGRAGRRPAGRRRSCWIGLPLLGRDRHVSGLEEVYHVKARSHEGQEAKSRKTGRSITFRFTFLRGSRGLFPPHPGRQFALEHLPRRRPRQVVDDRDLLGHLPPDQVLPAAEVAELVRRRGARPP